MEFLIGGSILGLTLLLLGINMRGNAKFQEEADKKYSHAILCIEMHKNIHEKFISVNEKLEDIPEIKETLTRLETKVDILLNGK